MVSTVPARAPLGASTTNRKWFFDVEDPAAPGIPIGVFGVSEFKFKPGDLTLQDDSDFDSGGDKSQTATARSWGGEGKLNRKTLRSSRTSYDPGQELLRRTGLKLGVENSLYGRFYEMEPSGPRVEAYAGYCGVTWSPDGGNMEALDTVSFVLFGQGALTPIAHPDDPAAVPLVGTILPPNAPATQSVVISGAGFDTTQTAAAYVKFGGVNSSSMKVLSTTQILAVMPAGSAATIPVVVGTSAPRLYTRGA